jgi:hypothetical protein
MWDDLGSFIFSKCGKSYLVLHAVQKVCGVSHFWIQVEEMLQ